MPVFISSLCRLTLAGLFFLLSLASFQPAHAMEKATVQLKWLHDFQFAGYYAALEKGFYDPTGIIYHPKPENDHGVLLGAILLLSLITITLTGTVLAFKRLNNRLNREIAERRETADALQQSHTLLNMLSQQVPGILFQSCLSPDGSFQTPYASGKSHEIYELSPAEIKADATAVFRRFHPDDRERIMATIMESANKLTPWKCDYRVLLPRQGLKWLFGTALPQKLEDGSVVWYGIVMDITERVRTEAELHRTESKYRNLHESMMDGYVSSDMQGSLREWNETFRNLLGYSPEEMCGLTYQKLTPEKWHDLEEDIVREQILTRGYSEVYEKEYRCSDGSILPVELRATLYRDESGEPAGMWAIVRDISERKHLQNESLKMQKLESLGVLAGGIAHDFNNILTGILGNISFARMFLDSSHKSWKILLEAEKASRRATELAHQLLIFSKGSQPIKKPVSPRHLLDASAALVLSGSNVLSIMDISDDLQALEADDGQISQAFNNILINAVQAMPNGGTITIKARNLVLNSGNTMGLAPGAYVDFTFADTGCGIPEEIQKNIFDPYFTTKIGGNGLGLASVYSIVTKHDGHVSMHSTPGTGTTFRILLPATHWAATESPPEPQLKASGRGSGSILVMDDEEIIRDLAAELLRELGYQVQTCANGEDAVELYRSALNKGTPFSATIMDLTIPGGMGGKEAAQQILEIDPQACLVVSSGYSNNPVMAEYARFGFSATLRKPYDVASVAQVLTDLVAPIS